MVAAAVRGKRRRAANEPHWAPAPIVWPEAVLQPRRPPALVYLDLNHWINMAKVIAGKVSPAGYDDLHGAALRACEVGRARFVLSASVVQEPWAIPDPRQRRDVAGVMEELTDFAILASPVDLMRVELLASVAGILGDSPYSVGTFPLVGTSVLHAFGKKGGLKIVDKRGVDKTAEFLAADGDKAREQLAQMQRVAERALLVGPEDAEVPDLRANGYRPEIPTTQLEENALIEQHFADNQLTDEWRRRRIRDVLLAREVASS